MNDELVAQVNAVSDAGEKSCARNVDAAKRQPRTNGANEKRGHSEGDQWKLPDAGGDGEDVAFGEIKAKDDRSEARQQKPERAIGHVVPPERPEFFNRGEHNTEHQRIETCPGRIVNELLKTAERDAAVAGI